MENTLDTFKAQQARSVELLGKLLKFLDQGEAAGVQIDPALKDKLQTAINCVAGEKLKVALIGGFSEGKTSIAAAWMEKLDKSSMKISHQERSEEHTSELQSLMRLSYAVFCLKQKKTLTIYN